MSDCVSSPIQGVFHFLVTAAFPCVSSNCQFFLCVSSNCKVRHKQVPVRVKGPFIPMQTCLVIHSHVILLCDSFPCSSIQDLYTLYSHIQGLYTVLYRAYIQFYYIIPCLHSSYIFIHSESSKDWAASWKPWTSGIFHWKFLFRLQAFDPQSGNLSSIILISKYFKKIFSLKK